MLCLRRPGDVHSGGSYRFKSFLAWAFQFYSQRVSFSFTRERICIGVSSSLLVVIAKVIVVVLLVNAADNVD